MKDFLRALIQKSPSQVYSRNLLREYLQARILGSLQRLGAMIPLAFHGGTALRILYGLPRHSQVLDFTLERSDNLYDLRKYADAIRSTLSHEGYDITLRINDGKVVHNAFIRFRGLLFELGLSSQESEVLAVKLEIDTNPPKGAVLETTVVRRHIALQIQHHNQATLFSGKIHAILQRGFTKGRDFYDLLWYLSDRDWPKPNLDYLNNALSQTGWEGSRLSDTNWKSFLKNRIAEANWERIREDVLPFLEDAYEVNLLTKDNLLRLLV